MWRIRRMVAMLVALQLCVGALAATEGMMYRSGDPMGLEDAKADVCWSQDLSAAYVTGKAFEIFLGPSVLTGKVDESIPYVQDVRVARTYAKLGPRSVESCHRTVTVMYEELSAEPHMARYKEILGCASDAMLSDKSQREHTMAVTFLASELSHELDQPPSTVCEALRSGAAKSWFSGIEAKSKDKAEVIKAGQARTCSADEERCRGGFETHALSECMPEEWRHCESCRDQDFADLTRGTYQLASQAGSEGFLAIKAWIEENSAGSIEIQVAAGAKAAKIMFMEVLLRAAEEHELKGFLDLFEAKIVAGDGIAAAQAEMRNILESSKEYSDVCKGGSMTCEEGKAVVRDVYSEVLERDADHGALMDYSRQLVAGHMTEADLRTMLQGSSEYRDTLSFKHGLIEAAEEVKMRYGACKTSAQNLSHPYWIGRWCVRDECVTGECRGWPLEAYRGIQAAFWGGMPISQVLIEGGEGGGHVEEYARAERDVMQAYVDALGRYPDPAAMKEQVGRLARKEARVEDLMAGLMSSGERGDREREASGQEESEWESIKVLVHLMMRHNVDIPRHVAACFSVSGEVMRGEDGCTRLLMHDLMHAWNEHGPLLGNPVLPREHVYFPIAMYVHSRPKYFQRVLAHLSTAHGIDRVPLLLVSMDSVNLEMLRLAEGVTFAPLRIVFHPPRKDAIRPASIIAIKSHWIWLQDLIWGGKVRELEGWSGDVALLEEDHAVTPDYLKVMQTLLDEKRRSCPSCWAVCARYGCSDPHDTDTRKFCASFSVINTGIAFDRATYEQIKASDFESFPDGWDWSLFHIVQTGQMMGRMLGPAVSRLENVGTEGATVNFDDDWLQQQLNYNKATEADSKIQEHEFYLDKSGHVVFEPPMWYPLYFGSAVRFAQRKFYGH